MTAACLHSLLNETLIATQHACFIAHVHGGKNVIAAHTDMGY